MPPSHVEDRRGPPTAARRVCSHVIFIMPSMVSLRRRDRNLSRLPAPLLAVRPTQGLERSHTGLITKQVHCSNQSTQVRKVLQDLFTSHWKRNDGCLQTYRADAPR